MTDSSASRVKPGPVSRTLPRVSQDTRLEPVSLQLTEAEEKTLAALYKLENLHGSAATIRAIRELAAITRSAVSRAVRSLASKGLVRMRGELGAPGEKCWEIHIRNPIHLRNPGAANRRWYGATMLALSKIAEKHQGDFTWKGFIKSSA